MKRLLKNLFVGFVGSALLVGCQGNQVMSNNVPKNNTQIEQIEKKDVITPAQAQNLLLQRDPLADNDNVDRDVFYNDEGVLVVITLDYLDYNSAMSLDQETYDELYVSMVTFAVNDYLPLYKYYNYEESYCLAVGGSDKQAFLNIIIDDLYNIGIYDDMKGVIEGTLANIYAEQEPIDIFASYDKDYDVLNEYDEANEYVYFNGTIYEPDMEPKPTQEFINEINNNSNSYEQPGVNPLPELNYYYPEQDTNLTYYSETLDGKSVFNVHIDNDSVQTADIRDYVWQYGEAAMGIDYIVFQFPDGNAVVDNNTLDVYFHQDLNYYRN